MDRARDRSCAADLLDPPAAAGLLHYAVAMAFVAAAFAGGLVEFGQAPPSDTASQTQDAVTIDLPPVEAGSHPQGNEAPPQEAAPASTGDQQPKPTPKPPDETTPPKPPTPTKEKVPDTPAPAAVMEQPAATPPAQAPASAPQETHVAGAQTPAKAEADDADEAETRRRASALLITLWQKALMGRLQAARHGLAAPHATGIAKIVFAIDHDGRLVSARVARSSGSEAIDVAALGLVRRAAPFPAPPAGARGVELTFVVPISFRRGD